MALVIMPISAAQENGKSIRPGTAGIEGYDGCRSCDNRARRKHRSDDIYNQNPQTRSRMTEKIHNGGNKMKKRLTFILS